MSDMKCSSCETMDASDCLSEATILHKLEAHPLWTLNSAGHLSRRFEAKNFQLALEFINLVGAAAERHGHHPDIHLTNYRQVEIVLFTHSVAGVTAEDFKLVAALDDIPAVYSMTWKKNHPDLAALTPTVAPTEPLGVPHGHSGSRHAAHEASLTEPSHHSGVHSSATSDDGSHLHKHDFKVHTGHSVQLGHGETRHHVVAEESSIGETIPASLNIPRATWEKMAAALNTLIVTGFDVGEAENYLSMIEMHAIHPAMEWNVYRFYKHLLHRLDPEVRNTEPVSVVEAALVFVEGYEELKGIGK